MIGVHPNICLQHDRIVYKFHKWKSNNWKSNCMWTYQCLLLWHSDDSRLWYLLLNFLERRIFSFMCSFINAECVLLCVHWLLYDLSFWCWGLTIDTENCECGGAIRVCNCFFSVAQVSTVLTWEKEMSFLYLFRKYAHIVLDVTCYLTFVLATDWKWDGFQNNAVMFDDYL